MAVTTACSPDKIRQVVNAQGGFATTEKFSVMFTGRGVQGLDTGTLNNLMFLTENVAIPTKSIAASDKLIYGLNYQMPYRKTFAEVAMNFYCTNNMDEKKFFDQWQRKIVDPLTGDLKFHENYVCDVQIIKYTRDATDQFPGDSAYSITLLDAWPSIVAEIQLSHGSGSEVARLPVTFQYRKWRYGLAGGFGGNSADNEVDD